MIIIFSYWRLRHPAPSPRGLNYFSQQGVEVEAMAADHPWLGRSRGTNFHKFTANLTSGTLWLVEDYLIPLNNHTQATVPCLQKEMDTDGVFWWFTRLRCKLDLQCPETLRSHFFLEVPLASQLLLCHLIKSVSMTFGDITILTLKLIPKQAFTVIWPENITISLPWLLY